MLELSQTLRGEAYVFLRWVIRLNKEQLRAELERQAKRYQDIYDGEVVTYAAQPDPERKPWRKRPTVQDQAFDKELERIAKEKLKKEQAAEEVRLNNE